VTGGTGLGCALLEGSDPGIRIEQGDGEGGRAGLSSDSNRSAVHQDAIIGRVSASRSTAPGASVGRAPAGRPT
jgi:hypothetical protein